MAMSITIDHQHRKLLIDGTEFPWLIDGQGPIIDPGDDEQSLPVVLIPVLTYKAEQV
jgi:hypothetical protein